jgi:hypothetical protein
VDLLALVDPKRDAVKGDWRMQDNMLVLRSGNGSQLIFPYQPPTEYDYCAEFIRSDAKYGNAMLFPHGNQTLHVGNSANGENFGPLPKGQGSGTLHIGGGLPHKVRIEVRTDRLRAFVDEKLILDYPTDYSEFEDTPKWTKQTTHLALQDFWSNVTYQKVEVIERSGPGTYFPPDGGSTQEIPSHAIKPASPSP